MPTALRGHVPSKTCPRKAVGMAPETHPVYVSTATLPSPHIYKHPSERLRGLEPPAFARPIYLVAGQRVALRCDRLNG